MGRSRVAVWAVLGFGALGICCVPGGAGRVTASGGPRCDTAIPTVTLQASAGQERFQVVSWDNTCQIHLSAVMDATPELVARYRLHEHGSAVGSSAKGAPVPPPDLSSIIGLNPHPNYFGPYTNTCRTSQSLHDVATWVLTEDDVFQTWTYNGVAIVSLGNGHTGTSFLSDGWQVNSVGFSSGWTSVPYSFMANGGASFSWWGGFGHNQFNQDLVNANGGCSGTFSNSGTAGVPNGYYTYAVSVS